MNNRNKLRFMILFDLANNTSGNASLQKLLPRNRIRDELRDTILTVINTSNIAAAMDSSLTTQ
jgi:hypothetical protein